jgi:hypothetical protein
MAIISNFDSMDKLTAPLPVAASAAPEVNSASANIG